MQSSAFVVKPLSEAVFPRFIQKFRPQIRIVRIGCNLERIARDGSNESIGPKEYNLCALLERIYLV